MAFPRENSNLKHLPRSEDPPLWASLPLALLLRLWPLGAPPAAAAAAATPLAEAPLARPLSAAEDPGAGGGGGGAEESPLLPRFEIMTSLAPGGCGCWLLTVEPVERVLVLLRVRWLGVLPRCCCCCCCCCCRICM